VLASWLQGRGGARARMAGVPPPSPFAEAVVAGLGGFRSLVTEALWFRVERLQDEGRFAELAQLSTWLTFLEPYTPEVWSYFAWNLAYNISVMMPTPVDRWRWVEAGIRLLRDDGLRLNPGEPDLHKELAWMFLHKLGQAGDSAAPYYRAQWRGQMQRVQMSGAWETVGMEDAVRQMVEREFGVQDWTHPYASALYWAYAGLRHAMRPPETSAKLRVRRDLQQVLYQTLMFQANQDARVAPRALMEMRKAYAENPSESLQKLIRGFSARFGL